MRCEAPEDPSSAPEKCLQRLEILRPFIAQGSVGAELGVFKGSFLDYLLSRGPSKLYAVDPWYLATANWPWARGDGSTVNALARILAEFKPDIESRRLVPIVDYSQVFLRSLEDGELDWVYIDTTHSYRQTLLELELCCKRVKPGGAIMGDDYTADPNHKHHGVYKAVKEFVADDRLELLVDGDRRQFVARPK